MHYEWGERGSSALIPRLMGLKEWDSSVPWAELWIGAHPKAPSITEIKGQEVSLDELIRAFPEELLGSRVLKKFGPQLPFLLKVLTLGEPLSIQAHPDGRQAKELHSLRPDLYPDDRHKPELAVSLGNFECLVGVKPSNSLRATIKKYPEIGELLSGDPDCAAFDPQKVFTKIISLSIRAPHRISQVVNALQHRLSPKKPDELSRLEELFMSLAAKYEPSDVGLLLIFLMNHLVLPPGHAVYLGPGIPHAYLSGTIVECMANSDNVVRVGLTPKPKDAEALIRIANCSLEPSIIPASSKDVVTLYKTPALEFSLIRYRCSEKYSKALSSEFLPLELFVLEGRGFILWDNSREELLPGDAFFIPAILRSCLIGFEPGSLAFSVHVP